MMYVLSDDGFFALGVQGVLGRSGKSVQILPFQRKSWRAQINTLQDGDTLLLAMDYMDVMREIMQIIAPQNIRVCIFLNKTDNSLNSAANGFISRSISAGQLLSAITQALSNNALRYSTQKLSGTERNILNRTVNGETIARIASWMNIAEKTVYRHRKNAMVRMGLSSMNAKAMLIYHCVSQLNMKTFEADTK
ncbi:helix-turn-helix transcriptional regulator [Enterobacter cloacae subsp. cloacae]|uniref:response regulator transcription factor n=1 Tax=Enterobacter cloacae TaxID=550 RepID=UPI001C5B7472|nr:LuxR C-terminal-related transcriptional regulator [Enterobacter cloacae]MBW4204105.1 helix-turn-helix transcriptional regulator [Enterobacter cloacae subsp. cloacae]